MDRRKNTKTFKNYSNLILILIIMMVMNAGAATFTSTLPMEPDTPVFPFGGEFTITLPAGFLDIELKDNEYFVYPPKTNYQWTVQSIESGTNGNGNSGSGIVRSGEGLTATIVSDEVGGSGVISAPGKYKVTFSGSVTYTIGWRVDGVEMTSGPHTETLRASHGGRLSMDFWLVAVDRIEISGNGASGVVSDATTTLLCGTKYTFTAYRNPANSPGWPSGFPYWAASSGIGLVANGDQAVCTFYSPDTALILNTWCGWGFYKQAVFKVVKPQIQVVEFPRIDIYDKDDRWQAPVGGLQAKNDPACFIQNQKSMVNVKFYCSENLTFPVTVSIRGDVHGFDEYITGDDYGRDNMVFATDWSRYGEIESESFTEAKIKDDYDVDISWRYKVRAPNGSDEWIDTGDTDDLTYYLVWDEPFCEANILTNATIAQSCEYAEGQNSLDSIRNAIMNGIAHDYTWTGNCHYLSSNFVRMVLVQGINASLHKWSRNAELEEGNNGDLVASPNVMNSMIYMKTISIKPIGHFFNSMYVWIFHQWAESGGKQYDPSTNFVFNGTWGEYEDYLLSEYYRYYDVNLVDWETNHQGQYHGCEVNGKHIVGYVSHWNDILMEWLPR